MAIISINPLIDQATKAVISYNQRIIGSKSHLSTLYNINEWKRGLYDKFKDPVSFFFKPFFYFDSTAGDTPGARLLGLDVDFKTLSNPYVGDPSLNINSLGFGSGYLYNGVRVNNGGSIETGETGNNVANSAMNFLLQNGEYERAEKLLQFIKLLSDISTYEPWTFQQLSGLDEALNRTYFTSGSFKLEEERKSIKIKCLQESYNSRIGTLMDLYRDICYSYRWKKEIVPANLRKFDMGIYIFTRPIRRFHLYNGDNASYEIPETNYNVKSNLKPGNGEYTYHTSVKYIELLNCEFDYNSNVGTYADIDTSEGKYMENEIKIFYDECYEMRYNEFLMRTIGDKIFQDTDFESKTGYFQVDENTVKSKLKARLSDDTPETINNEISTDSYSDSLILNGVKSIANNAISNVLSPVTSKFKTVYLGNLAGKATRNSIYGAAGAVMRGDIGGAVNIAGNLVMDNVNNVINRETEKLGNLIGDKLDKATGKVANGANGILDKINSISLGNLIDKSLDYNIGKTQDTINSSLRGESPISNIETRVGKKLDGSDKVEQKRGFVKTTLNS